jgi:phenylpyruvate tautomerase PptA (4-oxalocrotonate tautomerase family)
MGQIKIYGLKSNLEGNKVKLSEVIHSCVVDAFQYPENKKFHRFFPMEEEDFYYGMDRTEKYTIIEISVFEGRSMEAKKMLIRLLFERIEKELGILANDIEITIFETPKCNWGIRGLTGDELVLNYNVEV